jgi:hypothetical protein
MAFLALTDQEIAPDKAVTTDLLKKVKDNFDDHEARIGAGGGGSGGGIGVVLNGSFETDSDADGVPDNWTRSLYPGGSSAIDTTDTIHGKKAWRFVHPGGVGAGGGYLESDYISVSHLHFPDLPLSYKCSVAGIKVAVVCRYYAADAGGNPGTFLGERVLWSSVANPRRWTGVTLTNIPIVYANTRYVKYRLIGGENTVNVAGAVNFDAVGISYYPKRQPLTDAINQAEINGGMTSGWEFIGSTWTATIPSSTALRWLAVQMEGKAKWFDYGDLGTAAELTRFRAVLNWQGNNYAYGVPFEVNQFASFQKGYSYVDITDVPVGAVSLRFQSQCATSYWGQYPRLRSQNLIHYFGTGSIVVDCATGIVTENYG